MKVSEAKKKICPFMNTESVHIYPKDDSVETGFTCITKHCMAWTYVQTHEQIKNTTGSTSDEAKCAVAFVDGKELPEDEKEGFCRRLR